MSGHWRDDAACRGLDPELFFPERYHTEGVELAKAVCETCPVTSECLRYAVEIREDLGIFGGMTVNERKRLYGSIPAIKVLAPIPHGTDAGYAAHIRRRVPACPACLDAHSESRRPQDRKRKVAS